MLRRSIEYGVKNKTHTDKHNCIDSRHGNIKKTKLKQEIVHGDGSSSNDDGDDGHRRHRVVRETQKLI